MDRLFDRKLVIARRLRALRQPVDGADFLMRQTVEDLGDRLSVIERRFDEAVTLFCGSGLAASALHACGKVGTIRRIEAAPALLGNDGGIVEAGEVLPVQPESVDLVVSLLSLHEINDVPGLFAQVRRALRPDGLFLAAFAGAGTLAELRDSLLAAETELGGGAAARVYPFMDVRDAGALLQRAGFALPVTDVETVTVRYGSVFALMRDLRAMGAASALTDRPRTPPRRSVFERASEIYGERHADGDGRIRATFSIIWISGWAPHASQQKPLKPGSAAISLHDALAAIRAESDEN